MARAAILEALEITGARRFSYIKPAEGAPLSTVPGDSYYEAEAELGERLCKHFIAEYAPVLTVPHDRTFCQSTKSINLHELRAFGYDLAMVEWNMRMSHMHPDELGHWVFASGKNAPSRGTPKTCKSV